MATRKTAMDKEKRKAYKREYYRERRARIKAGLPPQVRPRHEYVYMCMESLESPVAIAEGRTARELAEKLGCSMSSIYSAINRVAHGHIKRSKYLRVILDEDEEE